MPAVSTVVSASVVEDMAEVFTRFLSDQIPVIACKNSRSGRMWRTFLSLTAMLEVALSLACGFFAIYLIGRWKIFRLEGVPVQVFQLLLLVELLDDKFGLNY